MDRDEILNSRNCPEERTEHDLTGETLNGKWETETARPTWKLTVVRTAAGWIEQHLSLAHYTQYTQHMAIYEA